MLPLFRTTLIVVVISLTAASGYADFTDPVVSVLDGDTLEVLHNQHPARIRFNGIDCPEKGQAYGKEAKQATFRFIASENRVLR